MNNYFTSPENAVKEITQMLQAEDWVKLSSYYDLKNCKVAIDDFTSGRYFIREEKPDISHPGGFWKYKHPFSLGFSFDYTSVENNLVRVHLSIEIDQGNGVIQYGKDSFLLNPNYSQIFYYKAKLPAIIENARNLFS